MAERRGLLMKMWPGISVWLMLLIPSGIFAAPVNHDYLQTIDSLKSIRKEFQDRFLAADEAGKKAILTEASGFLESALTEKLIPFWYGTGWDYNGTTQVPQKGQIACGYFITTLLRDAGFMLNRVKLAQMASSTFMGIICGKEAVKWSRSNEVQGFLSEMKDQSDGLYIVGLSWHVGFFWKEGKAMRFIHSSYLDPVCVVNDNAYQSEALGESSVFVYANLSRNDQVLSKWIRGESFE